MSRAYPGGSDGSGRSPSGNLKINAVFSLMSSEKCHITIFARPPATAMKFYYRRATADLFPSSHKIQITNISLSGLNIGGVIVKALESLNLDLVKCVACCMDGASSMSSLKIGVASVMKNAASLSEYYHCVLHKLNLCAASVIKSLSVQHAHAAVAKINNFFNVSPKRVELLKRIIQIRSGPNDKQKRARLITLCVTRFTEDTCQLRSSENCCRS